MTGKRQARVNPLGLILAAAIAPPFSASLCLGLAFLIETTRNGPPLVDLSAIGPFGFIIVLVTIWGFIPAVLFGFVGMRIVESLIDIPVRWPWILAGTMSAATYCAVGAGVGIVSEPLGMLAAPWFGLLTMDASTTDPVFSSLVVGSILASGAVAGTVYRTVRGIMG